MAPKVSAKPIIRGATAHLQIKRCGSSGVACASGLPSCLSAWGGRLPRWDCARPLAHRPPDLRIAEDPS